MTPCRTSHQSRRGASMTRGSERNSARYFRTERGEGSAGVPRFTPIAGGQSNPTYFVDYDDRSLVLRKQPAGELLPSAHAVDREYRVMAALAATGSAGNSTRTCG